MPNWSSGMVISTAAIWQHIRKNTSKKSSDLSGGLYEQKDAVPKTAPQMDTKIQFWVGTDEWGSRFRDLKWAMKYLPQMEVVKIPHMMHGEFVMIHPAEFAEKAFAFLLPKEQEH